MGKGSSGLGGSGDSNVRTTSTAATSAKWDYQGNDSRISQLSDALGKAHSASKVQAISRALGSMDKLINKQLDDIARGIESGDKTALMAQRRKVRQLIAKAKQSF